MCFSIRSAYAAVSMMAAACLIAGGKTAYAQTVTEQWSFKGFDANGMFSTVAGVNTGTGTLKATGLSGTDVGWAFGTSSIDGVTTTVANFQNASWLAWTTNFAPNGGGSYVNQYTVIMDVYFAPAPTISPQDGYTSLLQTASSNPSGNDGDLFIKSTGGVGISGDYSDTGNSTVFNYNAWNRLAFTVDTTQTASATATNTIDIYINGKLQNVVQQPSGGSGWGVDKRWSLDPTSLLFADDSGETNAGSISSLRTVNGVLSASQIAALGGPTAAGIGFSDAPEPSAFALGALGALPLVGLVVRRRKS
jgi:hypothetical protein